MCMYANAHVIYVYVCECTCYICVCMRMHMLYMCILHSESFDMLADDPVDCVAFGHVTDTDEYGYYYPRKNATYAAVIGMLIAFYFMCNLLMCVKTSCDATLHCNNHITPHCTTLPHPRRGGGVARLQRERVKHTQGVSGGDKTLCAGNRTRQ
jgi:hypothetical protein